MSKRPIGEEEFIHASYFDDHWFTERIADYVTEMKDHDAVADAATRIFNRNGLGICTTDMSFKIKDKKEYFERKYEEFMRLVMDKLRNWSLKTFSSSFYDKNEESTSDIIGRLNDCFEIERSYYIAFKTDLYYDITTMDRFIRDHDDGEIFYIGNILDYHW